MDLTLALTVITVLTLIAAWSMLLTHFARKERRLAESIAVHARKEARIANDIARRAKADAERVTRINTPTPVSRDELSTKFKGAAKKLINPARPQAQRSTDTPIIVADGGWSTPSSASCDTSSSSTDSGSCGGGE